MAVLSDEQKEVLEQLLKQDGYESIEDWMEDSDYFYNKKEDQWADIDGNVVDDPWIAFYGAKEAEADAIEAGF